MPVNSFERIQFCCDDIVLASKEYSDLFGREADWFGDYKLINNHECVVDSGKVAHFYLQNTCIELITTPLRQLRNGLYSIVFGLGGVASNNAFASNLSEYQYQYIDADGQHIIENHLAHFSHTLERYGVSLVAQNTSRRRYNLNDSSISRVDHLVLSAKSYESVLQRFGDAGLGMRLVLDKEVPKLGGRMMIFRCGKVNLEVMISSKSAPKADFFWGIAYETRDIDGCHGRLELLDISVSETRKGKRKDTRVATLKANDLGVPTLLVELTA